MSDAAESFETIAGCKIRMVRAGKGPTILLLHGGGGPGYLTPFVQKLSARYDVIVPEHPGFGHSDTPEWLDNVSDYANFYLDFIKHLGLDQVHLVGHSIGGWIAADLATRNTNALRSLTLMCPAGIHVRGAPVADIFLWSREELTRNLVKSPALAEKMLGITLSDEDRMAQAKNALTLAKVSWQPRFYDPDLRKWLHRIDRPTLLLWGDSDALIPPAYGPAFRDLIPGAVLQVIKDCGHSLPFEKPDETFAALSGFIDGVKS
jgi:pimeloyl-ACP methyl ester carboxylesterase